MSKDRVVVSVIMPVYNTPIVFLDECIASVLGNTYKSIELVIVDDCSNENIYEYLCRIRDIDDRVRVIRLDLHKGAAKARNIGMDNASGEYVLFLDSDDVYDKSMIDKMYSRVTQFSADIGICSYTTFDSKTKTIKGKKLFKTRKKIVNSTFSFVDLEEQSLINGWSTAPQNKIYRRKFLFDNSLRFQDLQSSNDVYFTVMSAMLAQKIVYCNIDEQLVFIRTGTSGQISYRRHPMDYYTAIKKIMDELKLSNEDVRIKQILVLLFDGAVFELNYSCSESESYEFYSKIAECCKTLVKDPFLDNDINQIVRNFRDKPFESYWFININNYLAKYRHNLKRILEGVKSLDGIMIWGYGDRGKAIEKVLDENTDLKIRIYDRKFKESEKSLLGNIEIANEEDAFSSKAIIASNDAIYEEISARCHALGIILLNAVDFE